MKFNVHAGHNPDGKVASGAIGDLEIGGKIVRFKESIEARKVASEVVRLLKENGYIAYDCTVDDGTSQNDVLKKIVAKCNKNNVDLDMSIHFNSGRNDEENPDGKNGGVEVLVYSLEGKATPYAKRICNNIAKLGFNNRGVKEDKRLYFLKHTKNPALLIECCFIDDIDDYEKYNYKLMAKAIVEGVLDRHINDEEHRYGVNIYDFNTKEDADKFSDKLFDKENAYNEVYKRSNGKWGIKVFTFINKENAEEFKRKLKEKYNAYSEVYSF